MEHETKKLEQLIKNLMSNDTIEQPSIGFTDKVMNIVTTTVPKPSEVIIYKPLISKTVWFTIFISFAVLVVFIYYNQSGMTGGWLDSYKGNVINPFHGIEFSYSKSVMYAFLTFALMVGIQIPLLRHYFNKRMVL